VQQVLTCSICLCVASQQALTTTCGHLFCASCIANHLCGDKTPAVGARGVDNERRRHLRGLALAARAAQAEETWLRGECEEPPGAGTTDAMIGVERLRKEASQCPDCRKPLLMTQLRRPSRDLRSCIEIACDADSPYFPAPQIFDGPSGTGSTRRESTTSAFSFRSIVGERTDLQGRTWLTVDWHQSEELESSFTPGALEEYRRQSRERHFGSHRGARAVRRSAAAGPHPGGERVGIARVHELDAPRALDIVPLSTSRGPSPPASPFRNSPTLPMPPTTSRLFPCEEPGCEYRANRREHLNTHRRRHTNDWPHICGEIGCEFKARNRGDLKRHTRTHTGELPFACDEAGCIYRAARRDQLVVHINSKH
jgi:hypothetical protein